MENQCWHLRKMLATENQPIITRKKLEMQKTVIASALLFAFASGTALAETHICVIPDQSAPRQGCIPFSNLNAYLHSASLHNAAGELIDDVVVDFSGTTYSISAPLVIDRAVTGRGTKRLKLLGSTTASTVLSGGRTPQFMPVPADQISAKGLAAGLMYASLSGTGIQPVPLFTGVLNGGKTPDGKPFVPDMELFYQDTAMPISRWPKSIGTPPVLQFGRTTAEGLTPQQQQMFHVTNKDLSVYQTEDDVRVGGYFAYEWAQDKLPLAYVDTQGNAVLSTDPSYIGTRDTSVGHVHPTIVDNSKVWFENALIDVRDPGEWKISAQTDRIYFLPPANFDPTMVKVSYVVDGLQITNANNVEIANIQLSDLRGYGIVLEGSTLISMNNLVVKNIAGAGIRIANSVNSTISNAVISNIGGTGVSLNGGNRKTLSPGNLVLQNATITNVGRIQKTYAPAVSVYGVGNRVLNSRLSTGPSAGLIFHGNNHLIQGNLVEKFALESDDVGGIYTGQDWTERGSVVQNNIVRTMGRNGMGAVGIYLDDQASGITVRNNLIDGVYRGILIGGGRSNAITGNIISRCSNTSIYLDGRGVLIIAGLGLSTGLKSYIDLMTYYNVTNPPYSTQYPELATVMSDQPGYPKYNMADSNISLNCSIPIVRAPAKDGMTFQRSYTAPNSLQYLTSNAAVSDIGTISNTLMQNSPAPVDSLFNLLSN